MGSQDPQAFWKPLLDHLRGQQPPDLLMEVLKSSGLWVLIGGIIGTVLTFLLTLHRDKKQRAHEAAVRADDRTEREQQRKREADAARSTEHWRQWMAWASAMLAPGAITKMTMLVKGTISSTEAMEIARRLAEYDVAADVETLKLLRVEKIVVLRERIVALSASEDFRGVKVAADVKPVIEKRAQAVRDLVQDASDHYWPTTVP